MGKLTQGILDELTAYFREGADHAAVRAQAYEPHGVGFDPATDTRLVTLMARHRDPRARLAHMALDELATGHVVVLRLATQAPAPGFPAVACRLPSAQAQGRAMAAVEARERALGVELALARWRGLSPMTCAVRVLEADAALEGGRRELRVTEREVERATWLGVAHGLIDVGAEATATVDEAVDAYVAAREALRAARRAERDGRRAEAAAAVDAALGRQEARERARLARRLRGAA